jgi:hypothetical protein
VKDRSIEGLNKVNKAFHKVDKAFSLINFVEFIAVGKKVELYSSFSRKSTNFSQ